MENPSGLTSVVSAGYNGLLKRVMCVNCERWFEVTAEVAQASDPKFCRECSAVLNHVTTSGDGCSVCLQRAVWAQSGQVEIGDLLDASWDMADCIVRFGVSDVALARLSFGAFLVLDQMNKTANSEDEDGDEDEE